MMKKLNFLFSVAIIATLILACKKESPLIPLSDASSNDGCINFDESEINEFFSTENLSNPFYFEDDIYLSGKYIQENSVGSIKAVPYETVQQTNSKFVGQVLEFKNVIIQFNVSVYAQKSKKISFDSNVSLAELNLTINGSPFQNLPNEFLLESRTLNNGYSITIGGIIDFIELGGSELAIDNFCINPFGSESNDFDVKETFEDTTAFYSKLNSSQTEFNEIFYSNKNLNFRSKFVNYDPTNPEQGSIITLINVNLQQTNRNFRDEMLSLSNADLEVDFSGLNYSSKKVSFDLSNELTSANYNSFQVNNEPFDSPPPGIKIEIINSGIAENGKDCFRIQLTGPINSIILKANNTNNASLFDNLCVQKL